MFPKMPGLQCQSLVFAVAGSRIWICSYNFWRLFWDHVDLGKARRPGLRVQRLLAGRPHDRDYRDFPAAVESSLSQGSPCSSQGIRGLEHLAGGRKRVTVESVDSKSDWKSNWGAQEGSSITAVWSFWPSRTQQRVIEVTFWQGRRLYDCKPSSSGEGIGCCVRALVCLG